MYKSLDKWGKGLEWLVECRWLKIDQLACLFIGILYIYRLVGYNSVAIAQSTRICCPGAIVV